MRRSLMFLLLFVAAVYLFVPPVSARAYSPTEKEGMIDSIVLIVAPSFGSIDELINNVVTIHPDSATVLMQTIWQKDDTVQEQQLFVAQNEDLTALVSLLYEHDFFNMPEYLETGILDGDFTWITVTVRSGESKRVGGLLATEYGPEDFIAICNAIDQALLNIVEYETYGP